MYIERPFYLKELIHAQGNGMVKILTGPRRCGKSFLLFHIFKDCLLKNGIKESQIIEADLENPLNIALTNPLKLSDFLKAKIEANNGEKTFVFIDEIQLCKSVKNPAFNKDDIPEGTPFPLVTFYDVLNGLISSCNNVDTYVTGSNSHMLSTDIATEFRGRGWQIPIHPLTFSEYVGNRINPDLFKLWDEYYRFGGLPACTLYPDIPSKRKYLLDVFNATYLRDVIDRYSLRTKTRIGDLTKVVASTTGSLVSFNKISNTFSSSEHESISTNTIKNYLRYLEDAFLISKVERYDIKGRQNIGGLAKYYFCDLGLRNAALGFKEEKEEPHLMENVVYNELIARGYNVNVGVVDSRETINGKQESKRHEVDFVADNGGPRFYIQCALYIPDEEKMRQEKESFKKIGDSFTKILITKYSSGISYDEDGILHVSLFDFLLKPEILTDSTLK